MIEDVMIRYLVGDATAHPGPAILAHIVNDAGRWGAGFSGALSRRWPGPSGPEAAYRRWAKDGEFFGAGPFALGSVQFVGVGGGVIVANMVAQHGISSWRPNADGSRPCLVRYDALRDCLVKVGEAARYNRCGVAMPRIGTGLRGSSWAEVEPIVAEELAGIDVTVYDLLDTRRR